MTQATLASRFEAAFEAYSGGDFARARALVRGVTEALPGSANAQHLAGVIELGDDRPAEAEAWLRRAIALDGRRAAFHNNLGEALRRAGRVGEARAAYVAALAIDPDFVDALCNLARVELADDPAGAADRLRRVAELQPDRAEAWLQLGMAYHAARRPVEAVSAWRRAVALSPGHAAAQCNLGTALRETGRYVEAEERLRVATSLQPDLPAAWTNLARVLLDVGEIEAALHAFGRSVALQPGAAELHSNLLLAMHYWDRTTPAALAAEHRRWVERHGSGRSAVESSGESESESKGGSAGESNVESEGESTVSPTRAVRGSTALSKRLKLALLSPDLCDHAMAGFLWPLVTGLDRGRFEVCLYSDAPRHDAVAGRFEAAAEAWTSIAGWSHEAVARRLRADGVDVVVDAAGHTARNRMPALAMGVVPHQFSYGAYHTDSGLGARLRRITDARLDPEHGPHHAVSAFSALAWQPVESLPSIAASQAGGRGNLGNRGAGGVIALGSFNRLYKFSDATLGMWRAVMERLPQAELHLIVPGGVEVAGRLTQRFKRAGLDPSRLVAHPPGPRHAYLARYGRIDIALDTFPYNGQTTTLEALAMGVPVVSLSGQTGVSRVGRSVLHALSRSPGLGDDAGATGDTEALRAAIGSWATDSVDAFADRVGSLAADVARLGALRATLRGAVLGAFGQASPAVRSIEATLLEAAGG